MIVRRRALLAAALVASPLLLGACGGSGSFRTAHTPESAPPMCTQSLEAQARAQCLAGNGEAWLAAIRPLGPELTFADTMALVAPKLHDARLDCIASYGARGCGLG